MLFDIRKCGELIHQPLHRHDNGYLFSLRDPLDHGEPLPLGLVSRNIRIIKQGILCRIKINCPVKTLHPLGKLTRTPLLVGHDQTDLRIPCDRFRKERDRRLVQAVHMQRCLLSRFLFNILKFRSLPQGVSQCLHKSLPYYLCS